LAVNFPDVDVIVPPLRLTGDNGAMIGAAAHIEWAKQHLASESLNADPGLSFTHAS
jgi:N6-L-threonylcarbamoyladenine synthase